MNRIAWVALIALLPVIGCTGKKTSETVETTLIDAKAGAAGAAAVRFTAQKGTEQRLTGEIQMRASASVDGAVRPELQIPVLRFSLSAEVTEGTTEWFVAAITVKDLTLAPATDAAAVDPMAKDRLAKAVESMPMLSGKLATNRRGTNATFELGSDVGITNQQSQLAELIRGSIAHTLGAVPSDAVGNGATWSRSATVTQNGMSYMRKRTYSLVQLANGGTELLAQDKFGLSADENGVLRTDNSDGIGAGPTGVYADGVKLTKLQGAAGGTFTMDWTQPLPTAAAYSMTLTSQMLIEQVGHENTIDNTTELTITLEPSTETAQAVL